MPIAKTPPFLCLLLFFTSCSPPPQQNLPEKGFNLQAGKTAFDFDPKKTEEITLTKTEATGEQWIVTLKRAPQGNPNCQGWCIISAPGGSTLSDRNANTGFINHLMDSLAQFRLSGSPIEGSMDVMGLAPPKFLIKWRTSEKEFLLHLGESADRTSGSVYAKVQDQVFLGSGSFLRLLREIRAFSDLRDRHWTLLSPDEIDEMEFFRSGKSFFYAQRDGDIWTNRKHENLPKQVLTPEILLEKLTLSEISEFIDPPTAQAKLKKAALEKNLWEAHLTDRFGKTSVLKMGLYQGRLYGINTTRPEGLFILPPALENVFKPKLK